MTMFELCSSNFQGGIKTARIITSSLRHADDTTLMAGNEEKLKSLLMNVNEKSEKAALKLNIQKTMIMVSSPIPPWQIDGEKSINSDRFYFLGLQKPLRF